MHAPLVEVMTFGTTSSLSTLPDRVSRPTERRILHSEVRQSRAVSFAIETLYADHSTGNNMPVFCRL